MTSLIGAGSPGVKPEAASGTALTCRASVFDRSSASVTKTSGGFGAGAAGAGAAGAEPADPDAAPALPAAPDPAPEPALPSAGRSNTLPLGAAGASSWTVVSTIRNPAPSGWRASSKLVPSFW